MAVEPFDRYWLEYDAWYDKHPGIYQSELWAVEVASRGVPRPWLEVGVGSGRFAAPLRVDVGLDASEKLLELAAKRGVFAVLGRAEELPFRDESFGGVFIIITLCFLEDPLIALKESRRVLRRGGRLIVAIVPRESPWGAYYSQLGRSGHRFYSYARFYAFSELVGMLEAAGFAVEAAVSTLHAPPGSPEALEAPVPGVSPRAGFLVVRARPAD